MKLYSIIYNFFHCISCKTLPEDFDPIYECDSDEEIQQWPYQFFMIRQ